MGHPKFKTCHVTQPRPFQGRFVVRWLRLATINLYTKYEVSMFTHYEDMKGKMLQYSLLSVGPGADPDVQAVSLQVTLSHPSGSGWL